MSSRRSYSKESRSYYSRSSSYENRSSNSSYRHRPLSSLLIERDYSSPSLAIDRFDDFDYFQRRSSRLMDDFDRRIRRRFHDGDDDHFFNDDDEEFLRNRSLDFRRNIPINSRTYQNSSTITRNIPIQYTTATTNQREKVYRKLDNQNNWSSNSYQNQNFNSIKSDLFKFFIL